MGITQIKIIFTLAGFVLIYLSGYLLHRSGLPFNAGVLALHKLVSLSLAVYLVAMVLNVNKLAPLSQGQLIACIVAGVLFVGAVVTGGILSAAKELTVVAQTMHKVLSVLTLLSTAVAFYLLYRKK